LTIYSLWLLLVALSGLLFSLLTVVAYIHTIIRGEADAQDYICTAGAGCASVASFYTLISMVQ